MVFILVRRTVEVQTYSLMFSFFNRLWTSFLKRAEPKKENVKAVLQFVEKLPQGVIRSEIPYVFPMKFTITLNLRKEKVSVLSLYFLMRTSVVPLNWCQTVFVTKPTKQHCKLTLDENRVEENGEYQMRFTSASIYFTAVAV